MPANRQAGAWTMPGKLSHALMFAAPGAGAARRPTRRYRGYLPSFPLPAPAMGWERRGSEGVWMGGDASFSCPLDATRSFWTFCDAGIAPPGTTSRRQAGHPIVGVGNSIAIGVCREGKFLAVHFFGGSPEQPRPFFFDPNNQNNDPKGSRLWLRKSLMYKGKLYIFAHQIMDPGPVYNTFIIRVANPLDSPTAWTYDYLSLGVLPPPKAGLDPPSIPAPFTFGVEAYVDEREGYLYTYGSIVDQVSKNAYDYFHKFQNSALRISLAKLESAPPWADLALDAQFMTSRFGEWKPGLFDAQDYHRVGIPSIFGYSVRYSQTLKAWQVVFLHDGAVADYHGSVLKVDDPRVNSVFIMTGPTAFGPWSRAVPVARIPEMDPAEVRRPDRPQGPDSYAYCAANSPPSRPGTATSPSPTRSARWSTSATTTKIRSRAITGSTPSTPGPPPIPSSGPVNATGIAEPRVRIVPVMAARRGPERHIITIIGDGIGVVRPAAWWG